MSAAWSAPVTLRPIGVVRGARTEAVDDHWGGQRSTIELDGERFTPAVVAGLEAFSHVEVVYLFHGVADSSEELGARRPRGNPDWPEVGILAQRAKRRPNRLGVSRCRLLGIDGLTLTVEALDAIEGTPVLDVKPWIAEFGPIGAAAQPDWATAIMAEYYAPGRAEG